MVSLALASESSLRVPRLRAKPTTAVAAALAVVAASSGAGPGIRAPSQALPPADGATAAADVQSLAPIRRVSSRKPSCGSVPRYRAASGSVRSRKASIRRDPSKPATAQDKRVRPAPVQPPAPDAEPRALAASATVRTRLPTPGPPLAALREAASPDPAGQDPTKPGRRARIKRRIKQLAHPEPSRY